MGWSPSPSGELTRILARVLASSTWKIDNILQIIEPSSTSHAIAVVPKTGTLACWEPLPYAVVYPPLIV